LEHGVYRRASCVEGSNASRGDDDKSFMSRLMEISEKGRFAGACFSCEINVASGAINECRRSFQQFGGLLYRLHNAK
jgi:hypothetical protein